MSLLRLAGNSALICISAVLVIATALATQDPKPLNYSDSVTAKASIEAIDKTNRLVTLKGPRGNLVVVYVGEAVKRFDQLKVGDIITATYTGSIAVQVRKPGDPDPVKEKSGIEMRKDRPGATATAQQTITVTIEEIDLAAPSVTVKAPGDQVLSFRVRDVKNLAGVKVGDKVDITYTIALLLNADPADK